MSRPAQFSRIAMPAALFMAAWLVPSIAGAHADHRGSGISVGAASSFKQLVRSADRSVTVDVATVGPSVELTPASDRPLGSDSIPCSQSPCSAACGATGVGCCVPAMPSASEGALSAPSRSAKLAGLPHESTALGAVPDALRRPPKSFV